ARFGGIEIPHRARAWAAANPHYKLTMEFIGDSLTAGACNEDGDTDQWEDLRTHNSACSYAAMTAEAFSADHRNIAVSGMGVSAGWTDVKAGQIWNRLYPKPSSPMADLSSWKPDVAFVFLGANDRSFTEAKGQPFPTDYTERYVSLVQEIRGAYPDSHIVLLMTNKYGPRLQQPWRTAVAQLEANDKAISHYVFERWVKDSHPRVADHRAMADGLILWLRKQSFIPHCQ
ncbi:MAG: SGNH/GDSL hydrolase family protein, partial [Candidatus Marinimicrobia bacterium]|nr:SGNH/GDSL hydrolase family protein [Candidatus Neomarinimicrobiota bacterium]